MPNMAATVTAIYRYPVKGLSAKKLGRVALTPGECLPHDRRFAIALGSTPFDPDRPVWLSKTHFIMLMRDEKLAQLRTRFEAESGILAIVEDGQALLRARLTEPEGCRLIEEFFASFLGDAVHRPLRVVAAPGHAFADARRKPNATTDQYVSLINRASIAALEDAIGVSVDPIRFRANVYFDGDRLERTRLDQFRDQPRRLPPASNLPDYQMRGDAGQSSHREARSRHRRSPRSCVRP